MCNSIIRVTAFITLTTLIGGCSTPEHTNTLFFGTNTKFALDVSVSPAGGTPDFTVGYKREEAVWMPLLANEKTGEYSTPSDCTDNCMFNGKDNSGKKQDTYSVLASFGAKFGGGSSNTDGGLAQFFATGIAAQNLANSGGARLVAVQSANAETTALALEAAENSKKDAEKTENELKSILGVKSYDNITSEGTYTTNVLKAKNGVIVAAIIDSDGKLNQSKWVSLVDSSTLEDNTKNQLKSFNTLGSVSSYLTGRASLGKSDEINAIHSQL